VWLRDQLVDPLPADAEQVGDVGRAEQGVRLEVGRRYLEPSDVGEIEVQILGRLGESRTESLDPDIGGLGRGRSSNLEHGTQDRARAPPDRSLEARGAP